MELLSFSWDKSALICPRDNIYHDGIQGLQESER